MAKKLNTDGLPEDVPSVTPGVRKGLFRDIEPDPPGERKAPGLPEEPPTRPAVRRHDDPDYREMFASSGEPRTVVAVGGKKPTSAPVKPLAESDHMSDPVVGWLVVVHGPGKGVGLRLGSGQNAIGRGEGSRVRIDFGDRQISRETHAVVTYDPKHNQFYIYQGTGTNLTYLNGDPVLSPTRLDSGGIISLGDTRLRFIAFCDESFTWRTSA